MSAELMQPTSTVSTPADPPANIVLVTPADTDLGFTTRAISFAADGTLHVTTFGGQELTIPAARLAPLMQHSMKVTRIWADSTATGIIAWY